MEELSRKEILKELKEMGFTKISDLKEFSREFEKYSHANDEQSGPSIHDENRDN